MFTSKLDKNSLRLSKFIIMSVIVISISLVTALVQKNQENRSKATGEIAGPNLFFDQTTISNRSVGDTFDVTIGINSLSEKIDSVDMVFNYDSSILDLITAKKSTPFVFGDLADCIIGSIKMGHFAAVCYIKDVKDTTVVNGNLLTLTFLAKSKGKATLSFNCVDGYTIDSNIVSSGKDLISCSSNKASTIDISENGTLSPTPTQVNCTDGDYRCPANMNTLYLCINGQWEFSRNCLCSSAGDICYGEDRRKCLYSYCGKCTSNTEQCKLEGCSWNGRDCVNPFLTPTLTKVTECTTGDKRCVDNGIRCLCGIDGKTKCVEMDCPSFDTQTCVNGVWKKSGTCSSDCTKDGVCKPTPTPTTKSECKTGDRRCVAIRCTLGAEPNSTSTVTPCHESTYTEVCVNGVWKKGETCDFICNEEGLCDKPVPTQKTECTTGDKRCVDNGVRCVTTPCYSFDTQTCVNGTWKKDGTCADSCDSNGVCKNPAPTITLTPTLTSDSPRLNSKISFYGIKPNVSCISSLNSVSVEMGSISDNKVQLLTNVPITPITNEVNSAGDQVFLINNLALDSSIFKKSNTFVYIKAKGPSHLKHKFCIDNQSKPINNNDGCNINLYSESVYNFSNYSLLPGDVNRDGAINGVDFVIIKNEIHTHDTLTCGLSSDLNLDGYVNSIDLGLVKITLSSRNDE